MTVLNAKQIKRLRNNLVSDVHACLVMRLLIAYWDFPLSLRLRSNGTPVYTNYH